MVRTPRLDVIRSEPLRRTVSRTVSRTVRGALLIVVVGLLVVVVAREWSAVAHVIGQLSPAALVGSALLAMAGTWFSFLSWRALLADLGGAVPLVGTMRIFFVGQLGKYVPGKVWPVVAQVRLGRRYELPGRISAASAAVVTLLTFGVGLLVTAMTLPALGGDAARRYWWALLALPVAVVVLLPPVLNRLLARVLRMLRREPMPRPLTLAGTGRAVGWALLMWLCYGAHLVVLLSGAGQPLTAGLMVRATGAFAASWAIGFLLAFAPAGLGVREIGLVGLLGAGVAQPLAVAATLISRLMLTLADLAWPALALAIDRVRPQRTQATPAGGASLRDLPQWERSRGASLADLPVNTPD